MKYLFHSVDKEIYSRFVQIGQYPTFQPEISEGKLFFQIQKSPTKRSVPIARPNLIAGRNFKPGLFGCKRFFGNNAFGAGFQYMANGMDEYATLTAIK